MSPIQNTSRFVHNFSGSVDNLHSSALRMQNAMLDRDLMNSPELSSSFDSISETEAAEQQPSSRHTATVCEEAYNLVFF